MTVTVLPHYAQHVVDDTAWAQLRAASRDTFGIVTLAQAAAVGISLADLHAAVEEKGLWQSPDGLWVVEDLNIFHIEDWAAAWLAIDLDTDIGHRRRDPESVICRQSAAIIRNLGDFPAEQLQVSTPTRLRSVPTVVEQTVEPIGEYGHDWDLVFGLPVATPGRIVADLAASGGLSGSHLGAVLGDILDEQLMTRPQLGQRLAPYLHLWSIQSDPDPDYVIDLLISSAFG